MYVYNNMKWDGQASTLNAPHFGLPSPSLSMLKFVCAASVNHTSDSFIIIFHSIQAYLSLHFISVIFRPFTAEHCERPNISTDC